jgi:hypothetical protein
VSEKPERPVAAQARRDIDPEALRQARRLAWLLDDAVRLPGGFRVGLDALLGVIPVVGDALGLAASVRIVDIARRAGVPVPVLVRMVGNIAGDALIGAIPLVGDLFDFGFKANARNVDLLEQHVAQAEDGDPRDPPQLS